MAKPRGRSETQQESSEQATLEIQLNPQMVSCSYAVVVSAPGGHINYDGNKLTRVFGSLGSGNVAQGPNGLAVILGDANQLIIQPPKILFKGANENILFELYNNARRLVLNPFSTNPATAFGINFQYEVEFPEISPSDALTRLLSDKVPKGMRLGRTLLIKDNTRITLDISGREPNRLLFVDFNNNIEKPNLPSFDNETLKNQFVEYELENKKLLNEIYQCLQKHQA